VALTHYSRCLVSTLLGLMWHIQRIYRVTSCNLATEKCVSVTHLNISKVGYGLLFAHFYYENTSVRLELRDKTSIRTRCWIAVIFLVESVTRNTRISLGGTLALILNIIEKSVEWHLSFPLMNSFNKTEAAIFPWRPCFLRDIPFIGLIHTFCKYNHYKINMKFLGLFVSGYKI